MTWHCASSVRQTFQLRLQLVSFRHLSDTGRRTPALTIHAGSSSASGRSATRQRSSSSSCRSAAASMAFGFVAMMSTGGGGRVGNDQTNRAPSDEQLMIDFWCGVMATRVMDALCPIPTWVTSPSLYSHSWHTTTQQLLQCMPLHGIHTFIADANILIILIKPLQHLRPITQSKIRKISNVKSEWQQQLQTVKLQTAQCEWHSPAPL